MTRQLPASRRETVPGARRLRAALLAALLLVAPEVQAGNILHRSGPGASGTGPRPQEASLDAAAKAAVAARQDQAPLRRALEAIRDRAAGQESARAAAQSGPSSVPDGLSAGGLEAAPGAVPGSADWRGAGAPVQASAGGRTAVTVLQNERKAILTWKTFNVGRLTDLTFDQHLGGEAAGSWMVLNRVEDPAALPSQILGTLKAQGHVYVLNRNGILFGGSSLVNVGTLVASGLDVAGATRAERDRRFLENGVLGWTGVTFGGDPAVEGGAVTTEAGARIVVAPYGQALLLGGQVVNGGSVEAPDGQVVLAAGRDVLLARRGDQRGYVVKVNRGAAPNRVANDGSVSVPRGNITLQGSTIEQNGLLSATTSPQASGSITVGTSERSSGSYLRQSIDVAFGGGSVTQILPDPGGQKLVGSSGFDASALAVRAERITLQDGASVYLPAGSVTLAASVASEQVGAPDLSRVYVGAGARIDVSGLRDVEVAMEQNTLRAELRANELRDNPVLRDGPLRGQTVYFDARRGVKVADLSGYYGLVERGVEELMTAGGSVALGANEIVVRRGSTIDLSGGSVRFADGWTRSTWLLDPAGKRVRIEDAVAGVRYLGVDGGSVVEHPRWGITETFTSALARPRPRFEKGYVEGRSAGRLTVGTESPDWFLNRPVSNEPAIDPSATGAFRILEGDVVAATVVGPNQRGLHTSTTDPTQTWRERPAGASLDVQRAGGVIFTSAPGAPLDPGFGADTAFAADDPHRYRLELPSAWFDGRTITGVTIVSGYTDDAIPTLSIPPTHNMAPGGGLTIPRDVVVDLGDGGAFSFSGKRADMDGTVRAPGGTISLRSVDQPFEGGGVPAVRIGATGVLDAAGRLTNDRLGGAGPQRALAGGTISLVGTSVVLEEHSLLDVGGGARVDATGTKVTAAGDAGSILLDASQGSRPVDAGPGPFTLLGELRGFAAGKGGTLTLATADAVQIGGELPGGAGPGLRLLAPSFFGQGGFSSYAVVARGLTIAAGTLLAPQVETLVLPAEVGDAASGTHLLDLARRQVLPEGLRKPMALQLTTVPRGRVDTDPATFTDLRLEAGARISMAPGSSVKLAATRTLDVAGTIEIRGGGSIELAAVDLNTAARGSLVHLGPEARLLAPGYQKDTPDGPRVRHAVVAGGSVVLNGANEVVVDAGAVIDVSGVRGLGDLEAAAPRGLRAPYETWLLDGAAGSVSITAARGTLAGTLRMAPGGESGAGGTLGIRSLQGIHLRQAGPLDSGAYLAVDAGAIDASGADAVTLATLSDNATTTRETDAILFQGDVALRSRRSLVLQAPVLLAEPPAPGVVGAISLTSGYVLLKGGTGIATSAIPTLGANLAADLAVSADLIDVRNAVWLGCITQGCSAGGMRVARLHSSGDLRFSDQGLPGYLTGLLGRGAIELRAAQVYVTSRLQALETATQTLDRPAADPGFLVRSDASITVLGASGSTAVPLSFGERLTLRAPTIVQGGVLRAPQGQIRLEGAESVRLLPGSLTSTSLEGAVVPFGAVNTLGGFVGYDRAGVTPEKSISIVAPTASLERGAVLDVSGGGDLLGYRFVPGNGGSSDYLDGSGAFAVVPSLGRTPAPVGGVAGLADARLVVGDSVWLQGVPGLAPGAYTLLPAHYALLPGGFLVKALGGTSAGAPETFTRPDGALVVAGRLEATGTPVHDPGYRPFLVVPQEVFGRYGQLLTFSYDAYARQLADGAGLAVRTPADAGTAVLDAHGLLLQGSGRFGAGPGGLLGALDVSAAKIAVLGPGRSAGADYLVLDAGDLSAFGAGSLLLGARRSQGAAGTTLAVAASDVVVDTGPGGWTGSELILAATGSIMVRDGSTLVASGAAPGASGALQVAGDGALLRLSAGDRVAVGRTGAAGAAGDLAVGLGTLSATGSLALDGTRGVSLAPAAALSARQLDVSSARVNLGEAPAGEPGTTLGAGLLASLARSADLLIRGNQGIVVYRGADLGLRLPSGAATLAGLTLDTGVLEGRLAAGESVRLTAARLTLQNGGTAQAPPAAAGSGRLELDADLLVLGPGKVQVAGFSTLQASASSVEARGADGLAVAGEMALAAGQIGTAAGARYAIDVTGGLAVTSAARPAVAPGGAGGTLLLAADHLSLDTAVVLPAGGLEARTRAGDLLLGPSATVDVRGVAVDLGDQLRTAPGGSIRLSAAGDLVVASGATLDVSGSARGGDAGTVELSAGGRAAVPGSLHGTTSAGGRGASFALDAATVDGFAELNRALEAAVFDRSRSVRVRQQDLALAAGERITAHRVELRSDGGRVAVAGEIAAGGSGASPDGGVVRLAGGAGVALAATARIDARTGQAPAGGLEAASGLVELAATGGRVDVAPGAVVELGGGRSGGGSVVVRAPRQGDDLAVDRLGGELRGAREVVVQGVATYQAEVVDDVLAATLRSEAAAWLLAGRDAVSARLAATGSGLPPLAIAPGMVVASAGGLTVTGDLSLDTGADQPGYLELRARGDLDVRAAVSDGFAGPARDAALRAGRSSSLVLASGGNLTLQPGVLVRTGTGSITVEAGGDLVLVTPATTATASPAIYTAGRGAPLAGGFLGAPAGLPLGEVPVDGGDVSLRAGRDILAPFPAQTTSAWLYRYGSSSWQGAASASPVVDQTSWSVVLGSFASGVGALGGGRVDVVAGRDVVQLQVAIPTTGQLTTSPGSVAEAGDLVVRGGGDLSVTAGRDLLGGIFVLGRGHADLRAGGRAAPGDTRVPLRATADGGASLTSSRTVGALFGLMDATATLTAGAGVEVEGAFDPMLQGQVDRNKTAAGGGAAFMGTTERTALDVTSVSGSIVYRHDPWASVDLSAQGRADERVTMTGSGANALNALFGAAPPTLRLAALDGSVALTSIFSTIRDRNPPKGKITLAAAGLGTLELLAARDVKVSLDVELGDTAPDYRRGPLAPLTSLRGAASVDQVDLAGTLLPAQLRGATPIHAADPDPLRIRAVAGTICADISGACLAGTSVNFNAYATIVVPKPIDLVAGKDVLLGDWQPQHNGPWAVSVIRAGRDTFDVGYEITGPGTALLLAGRDVVEHALGSDTLPAWGGVILAKGDNRGTVAKPDVNPALPHGQAADLVVMAGLAGGVDEQAFAAAYLDAANARVVARTYLGELGAFLEGLGLGTLPEARRLGAFQALPWAQRLSFLDQVLFAELKATGIDYNDPESARFRSYQRGFDALATYFPAGAASAGGNVLLGGKPLETWAAASGGISVMAPRGRVEVGAASLPASYSPVKGGVVTRRGGGVRILADGNVDLFTSRVFTLQGGDITMWSSGGSITAGAGSKTSVFDAPLAYAMSNDGVVTVDVFGLQTGAGIGVLDAVQGSGPRKRSRLDLIAPLGEVNAGDAGIRVVGDINIAAQVVVGMENIQVSGAQSGVPQVQAPNPVAVSAATQVAQTAARDGVGPQAAARANPVADVPSIITVEVVGYEVPASGDDPARRKKPAADPGN